MIIPCIMRTLCNPRRQMTWSWWEERWAWTTEVQLAAERLLQGQVWWPGPIIRGTVRGSSATDGGTNLKGKDFHNPILSQFHIRHKAVHANPEQRHKGFMLKPRSKEKKWKRVYILPHIVWPEQSKEAGLTDASRQSFSVVAHTHIYIMHLNFMQEHGIYNIYI